MKYIVYLTTNKVNNKIYVGVHKTEDSNKFDNYIGCGVYITSPKTYKNPKTPFQSAVLKYGVNNFIRHTIRVFNNLNDALDLEKRIVNQEFIKRTDTYNITIGGGLPPDLSKIVYQFDLNGNLIKEWKNQVEITTLYHKNKDLILNCITNIRSFLDCYWSHNNKIDISEYRLSRTKCIYYYNQEGLLLCVFDNIQDASIKLDIDKNRIINAISQRSSIDGCYFLTISTSIEDVLKFRENKNGGKKKVYRYNLDNKYDREYNSLADAARDCGLKQSHSISDAIKSFGTSGGYKWSFIKSEIYQEVTLIPEIKPQKVGVYDLENNLIKTFETVSECMKEFPYCRRVLRN
jgi:hypothetical protein